MRDATEAAVAAIFAIVVIAINLLIYAALIGMVAYAAVWVFNSI